MLELFAAGGSPRPCRGVDGTNQGYPGEVDGDPPTRQRSRAMIGQHGAVDRLPSGWGTSAADFRWAVGIEDTFVPQTRAGHRPLDEYELMDHYRLWRDDLDKAADLGVSTIRYGIPWYKVNPAPGVFDWSWTDEVLEHLVVARGLEPIVDLMHYGTPHWLDNGFVNASYPRRVAEYAARFAERYSSLIGSYTPLNEPGVTANFCGRDGRWPPYLSGADGYVKVLLSLAEGMALTAEALRAERADTVLVHVEDVGLERTSVAALADHAVEAQLARLLPLDLACGLVEPGHPRYAWLVENGAEEDRLATLAACAPDWDVLGVNYYPWSNRKIVRRRGGTHRAVTEGDPADLDDLLRLVHGRYGLPLMVTETSAPGSHLDRARWMRETVGAVRRVRSEGLPVVGYTWFPMFTMIEWKYRWSRKGLNDHLLHLGLFDVKPSRGRMDRKPTPLVDAYRALVSSTAASVGDHATAPEQAVELVA